MPTREYLNAHSDLKKWNKPRHPEDFNRCLETGEYLDNLVLVVAPPDYPQLAEGLAIGSVYEFDYDKTMWFGIAERSSDGYFFEWCEKLVALVTNGKKLEGGSYRMVDWCTRLSESVEGKEKYPETEGRGPFWELLRYMLRGMTFGPVVCKKLVADFNKWDSYAWSLGDYRFYQEYLFFRKCFEFPGEHGLVFYPSDWYEGDGTRFREPKLGADPVDDAIAVVGSTGSIDGMQTAHVDDDI